MTRSRSRTLFSPMPLDIGWSSDSGKEPHPVVVDLDDDAAVFAMAADRDRARTDLAREAVLDRVLDQRLQDHAGDDEIERVGVDVLDHFQLGTEANDLDVQVFVDRFELFTQRHEMLVTPAVDVEAARKAG